MKKLLLASAVAALSITAAQAAPTVYGKAFLTLDLADGDDNSAYQDSRSQLNSTGSRIGLKGSEALTQNTDLVYQLEYGVKVDDNSAQFTSRDTYLGLANKQYGTLVAGRLTSIDDYVNYANVAQGGVLGGNDVLASFNAERANNAFAYFSPERNGVQFMGMYAMDENKVNTDNLAGDAFGLGVKYEPTNAPYKVGATYIKASQAGWSKTPTDVIAVDSDGDFVGYKGENMHAIRVSGAYAVSPVLTLGGLYQNTDWNTDSNENAVALSATYNVAQTPWTTYGQLDLVDNAAGVSDAEAQRLVVGGKYAFNQATTGHLYSAYLRSKDASNEKADAYGIGGGIEYKF